MNDENKQTPFDMIGEETLSELVDRFYELVSDDPNLSPIFPDDLTETARKQKQFLTQFLGGPSLYSREHGHPMLRARHMPFPITPTRAESWLNCMKSALDETDVDLAVKEYIFERLTYTAKHMINTNE
ncbi:MULTISPECIES: globin [Bacillaceae]|uniref:Globin n=1 Tax=Evansella alkalicola TaxID=745819 RepID=A0ABS6JYR5_9BACI|nr:MULTISPECIES: globin [Bacillaceae]MBU9723633.1 globin [Bacillus alkalicola]